MSQRYLIVNLSKAQFIKPSTFWDGGQLKEFGAAECGTMLGLAALLACSSGGGGGDVKHFPEVGSWAGDCIVVAGKLDVAGLHVDAFLASIPSEKRSALTQEQAHGNLYQVAKAVGTDISQSVARGLGPEARVGGCRHY